MKMQDLNLSPYQLFHLKRNTLENRITWYYNITQNSNTTIQYILTLKVRHLLGAQEFRFVLKDLVRHLFIHTKATRTMKRFFHYFKDYFAAPEWRALSVQLFSVTTYVEKAQTLVRSLVSLVRPDKDNKLLE